MVRAGVVVRLTLPEPFLAEALLVFFGRHAVPGVEAYRDEVHDGQRRIDYARTIRLPSGPAALELSWSRTGLAARVHVADPGEIHLGRRRLEELCDVGRDLARVEAELNQHLELASLVRASSGLRVPGTVDVHEHLIRTMIGQQISLAAAANCAGKLAARYGDPWPGRTGALATPAGALTRLFPTPASLTAADPATLPMPAARGRALVGVATALASGDLVVTADGDVGQTRAALLAMPGIGPWTADYVAMRGLRDPDVLLGSDLVIKRELRRRAIADTSAWSPWRSYATMHLWRAWTG